MLRIRDPVPFWPRDPGWVKKAGFGSGMNNPDHISEGLNTIFWVKILKFFDADTGWKNPDPGYGMEKIRIRETSRIRNTGFYYCWSLPSAVYVCDVLVSSGSDDPVVVVSLMLLALLLCMSYLFFRGRCFCLLPN